jgi:hypothetical protein
VHRSDEFNFQQNIQLISLQIMLCAYSAQLLAEPWVIFILSSNWRTLLSKTGAQQNREFRVHISGYLPVLYTERLVLLERETADAAAIRKMRSNQAVNRFIGQPAMEEVAAAVALAENSRETYLVMAAGE